MPVGNEPVAVSLAVALALATAMLAVLAAGGAFGGRSSGAPGPPGTAACGEWTDGCAICARTSDGLACSTPGIACIPGAGRCLKP
jgi:hypothetical protein